MTNVDNETESEYGSSEPTLPTVTEDAFNEELQEIMFSAFQSNDPEKIKQAEAEVASRLKLKEGVAPIEEAEVKPGKAPEINTPAPKEETNGPDTPSEEAVPAKDGDPSPENTTSKTDAQQATDDWLNSLTPEVRARVEQQLIEAQKAKEYHEQYVRSNQGRLQAYQRQAEEAKRRAQELEAKLKSEPSTPAQAPAGQTARLAKIEELSQKIERVKKSDPELADLLETTRDALVAQEQLMAQQLQQFQPQSSNPKLEAIERQLEEERELRLVAQGRAELDRLLLEKKGIPPGFANSLFTPSAPNQKSIWEFFFDDLPPYKQKMIIDNPYDPEVFADVIANDYTHWAERYNAAHGYSTQPTANSAVSTPATHSPATPDPRAAQAAASRQAKVATTATAPVKANPPLQRQENIEELLRNPPANMTPQEYEELQERAFKYFEQKRLKELNSKG